LGHTTKNPKPCPIKPFPGKMAQFYETVAKTVAQISTS